MVRTYSTVHYTKTTLASELKLLADEYKLGSAKDEEVKEVLGRWKKNSANLLCNIEESHENELSKRIGELIGVKRKRIIQAFLNELSEQ